MEFQIHRPVLNCLELGDRPHVPVTYHEISSLGMEDIGEYLYPQASLRREIFQQPAVPTLRRGPQVTCSSRGMGRTSTSFQTSPTCPLGQRSFPLRGQSLSASVSPVMTINILGVITLCLGVKAVDAKDGVSHVRPRPACSQEAVNDTHWCI